MKRFAKLATIVGLAASRCALAKNEEFPITSGTVRCITPTAPAVFSGRLTTVVWGTNQSDFRGYNTAVPPPRAANDINFAGGPAESVVGGVSIVQAYYAVVTPATATIVNTDVRVSLYSTFGGWIDGAFPGGNLLAQETVAFQLDPCPFVPPCPPFSPIPFDPPVVMANTAGTDGMFMVEAFLPGTTTLHPTTWIPASIGTALTVGSSDPQRWGDSTGPGGVGGPDGLVQPLNGTAVWEVNSASVAGGRAIYGGLWADIPVPLPTPVENIGCLADGVTTRSTAIPASTVKWYQVCLNTSADDDFLRYLDVDSEGSIDAISMCLYDPQGNIAGYPGISDFFTTQLSFGVGRRAALGNGAQYDGRMGDLSNGVYYLALAGQGATFGNAFTVNASAVTTPTTATINFKTNINNGANLPSVTPIINGVNYNDFLDEVLPPGDITGVPLLHDSQSVDQVRWSTFTLERGVCASSGYLDFNFNDTSVSDTIADGVAWLFDYQGNIVAFSDDTGGTNKPQFSFGITSPSRPPFGSSTQNFSGQDGDLPAGTYYLATALFDAEDSDLSFLPTGHRWHVRGAALSTSNLGANLYHTPSTFATCTLECDSIDFNNDTSLFDPQDIDAFLSVYSEGPCVPATATCNDVDFNNDGSVFDPCDIDSFLLRYAEGPCTPCG